MTHFFDLLADRGHVAQVVSNFSLCVARKACLELANVKTGACCQMSTFAEAVGHRLSRLPRESTRTADQKKGERQVRDKRQVDIRCKLTFEVDIHKSTFDNRV